MFKATWVDAGDIPVVGDSAGAFVQLANNPTATANVLGQIGTVTNGVPSGFHRVSVSNGAGNFVPLATSDLSLSTPCTIVMRYDVDTAQATLWVDPVDESSPGVAATDLETPASISYVTLRQDLDMGNIYVDDLKVVAVPKPVLTGIAVPTAGTVEIAFTGGPADSVSDFAVEGAGSVGGPYGDVAEVITSPSPGSFAATVSGVSGDEGYYRVKRVPRPF
jgi:hypothetical protein